MTINIVTRLQKPDRLQFFGTGLAFTQVRVGTPPDRLQKLSVIDVEEVPRNCLIINSLTRLQKNTIYKF
jgi:hypothetical protein